MIDQSEPVRDQMVGHIPHDFTNPLALGLGVGAEIVIERVEEIVPVHFVAAGV